MSLKDLHVEYFLYLSEALFSYEISSPLKPSVRG
jgi:hypothetical protein